VAHELAEQGMDVRPGANVDRRRRLFEQPHLCVRAQRAANHGLLLIASRARLDGRAVARCAQAEAGANALGLALLLAPPDEPRHAEAIEAREADLGRDREPRQNTLTMSVTRDQRDPFPPSLARTEVSIGLAS